jgi:Kef-type K+ transport system membrane component KefB
MTSFLAAASELSELSVVAAEAAEEEGTPLSLVLIALGAFAIPLLSRRIGLPAVVLEIGFGVIIGPEILDVVRDASLLEFLSDLGLLLLMFLAGFEIDFGRLQKQGRGPLVLGLASVGAIFLLAYAGAGWLDLAGTDQRVFLTLLIGASALGLVIPTLRATRRSGTQLGQTAILVTVLAEVASLIGIVIFLVLDEQGLSLEVLNVPGLFLIIALILVAIKRAAWWYPEKFERLFDAHDPEELGIRATLALMFVLVGVSLALNIEDILGAFLAGALFAFVFRERGGLEQQLSGFAYGFFIPIFFIFVGVNFPLSRLGEGDVLAEAVKLIIVAIGIKILVGLAYLFRGYSVRESLGLGVLWAGQLSVIIALAGLGVERGLLSEGAEAGAILLVAVTAMLTPVVFRLLQPELEEQAIDTVVGLELRD